MHRRIAFVILSSLFLFSCQKEKVHQCERPSFETLSLDDFKTWVYEHTTYKIEKGDCSQSSWIKNIEFYHCESNYGYLYLSTSTKEYIYEGISYDIWTDLKRAESIGRFYNTRIKGRYNRLP